ncbi:MAG: copper-binding protein [Chloroflexi bacterium]|nr:copper-binding protein [Chloroflexota bacterium]
MTRIRSILLGTGTSLVLVLSACGNGPPPDAGTGGGGGTGTGGGGGAAIETVTSGTPVVTVKETDDLKFDPATATAKSGDIVAFTNSGTTPHNVTFDAGVASPTMSGGDQFLVKFAKAGTYKYVCTFHAPGMAGTITVG